MRRRSPKVAQRRAAALRMRAAGRSTADIADELYDGNADTARRDISRALSSVVQEAGDELLTLETTRTEAILAAAFGIINNPDASDRDKAYALREATRVLDRRAKLLGLDADSKAAQARKGAADLHSVTESMSLLDSVIGGSLRIDALAEAFRVYAQALADTLAQADIPGLEALTLPTPPNPGVDYSGAWDNDRQELPNTYDPWPAERVSDLPPQA